MEFPVSTTGCITREHGTTATAGKLRAGTTGQMDSLWFVDPDKGSVEHWDAGTLAVGEPIFLPGNENNYWGAFGTDVTDMTSWFVVLSADDPTAGPLARVRMPIRVPAGLHGAWMPA